MASDCFSDEQIAGFLSKNFDVPVTTQEMRQCKPDFVQKMYCNFLLDFGVSLEQVNQLPFDVCDSVRQYHSSYASVGRIMILAKVVSHFLKQIDKGVEFFPADLFDPNTKRTMKFFSLLIDFYVCSRDNIESLEDIEEQAKIKNDAKCELMEDNAKKLEKIGQIKHENESVRIREEQMLKRIAEVRNEMQEIQVSKMEIKGKFDQLKIDVASFTSNIKATEIEMLERKDRLEILASQVIQLSERQEIEERESRLASYRNDNAVRSENLASLKQAMEINKTALDMIRNELMPVIQDIQQEISNTKEYSASIDKNDRVMRSCIEEVEEQEMKIQQINGVVLARQEKISQMQMAWKLKKELLQGEMNQLKETLTEIWRNQTEDEIVSQDLQKERMIIIREIDQLKQQIHQFDLFVAENYHKILKAIEKQNSKIQESLAAVVEVTHQNDYES